MTKEFPKNKPLIDLDAAAYNFGAMMEKVKAFKKASKESGEAIIVHFGEWGLDEKTLFNYAEEFMHGLFICLNAVYNGQATVTIHQNPMYDSTMFKAKVIWEHVIYAVSNEGLYNDAGEVFQEVLKGMCDKFDDSKVIYEYKMPKRILNFASDDLSELTFPGKTPVSNSFDKLKDSGVVTALATGLSKGSSIKLVGENDLVATMKKFQTQMEKMEKSFYKLEFQAKLQQENIKKLGEKIPEYATDNVQSYGDSGYLLKKKFPGLNELANTPCKCGRGSDTIHDIIIHLNDAPGHGRYNKKHAEWEEFPWSREQIADWLETLDVKLELKED